MGVKPIRKMVQKPAGAFQFSNPCSSANLEISIILPGSTIESVGTCWSLLFRIVEGSATLPLFRARVFVFSIQFFRRMMPENCTCLYLLAFEELRRKYFAL